MFEFQQLLDSPYRQNQVLFVESPDIREPSQGHELVLERHLKKG